jgi:hypothetical protein
MLRHTQPGALNDPFELRPYFDQVVTEESLKAAVKPESEMLRDEIRKRYEARDRAFRRQIPFKQFYSAALAVLRTEDGQETMRAMREETMNLARELSATLVRQLWDELSNRTGILSLSEDGNNQLMWAHYASAHAGFNIGFDSEHAYFDRRRSEQDEFNHLRQVEYRARDEFAVMTDLNGTRVLASKTPEWEYEKEWRMVSLLADADSTIGAGATAVHLFQFPPEAVQSVTLGLRASHDLEIAIRTVVSTNYPHARIKRVVQTPSGTNIVDG